MNKITATAKNTYAKFADRPATPPKPKKLAMSAITAKIIAQRNMITLLFFIVLNVLFLQLDILHLDTLTLYILVLVKVC